MNKRAFFLAYILVFIAALSIAASATVQPPIEWLNQSAANRQKYEQMKPQLQQWMAGDTPDWRLPEQVAMDNIGLHLGQTRVTRTVSLDSPELRFAQLDLNNDGVVDQFDVLELGYAPAVRKHTSIAGTKGTNKIIAVRVEFSDQAASSAWDYTYTNNLLLADGGANASFRDYYQEVSYGDLDIQGTIDNQGPHNGWYTAPNTRSYYVNNIGELLLFAAQSIDAHTDFSEFDVDGDGYVDSFMLFYPYTSFDGGLWPHMSSGMNYYADGVIVDIHYVSGFGGVFSDSYNMCCAGHEYGHIMGMPDLYDYGYDADGVGRWSMMAYNYDNSFKPPAFDPWNRMNCGWINPLVVTEDTTSMSIPQVETNRFVLKLWKNGNPGEEYFLVENLQLVGTDATRPGAGLMIFHCDDTITNNNDQTHKLVDVECADGLDANGKDHLDYDGDGNNGDANDPFRSGNNATFNFSSNPPSKSYANADSYVKVENISASAATMTADIYVETGTNPTVTITAPTADSTVGGDVTFSATAIASGVRTISKVDFYANGYFVGSDNTATGNSFSISWNSRTCYNKTVSISAKATDSASETSETSISVTVSNSGVWPFSDNFTAISNWAIYNPSGSASWGRKTAVYNSSPSCIGIGPGYDNNEHDRILSPLLDLTGATAPAITYYIRYKMPGMSMHNARIYAISADGSTEDEIESFTGTDTSWKSRSVWLDDYVGQEIFIAFELNSMSVGGNGGTDGGVWIDDVDLHERSAPPELDSITPGDGSSVSGDVAIEVDATDDIAVTYVEYWMDGSYVGADSTAPFVYTWNSRNVFNGPITVMARAYDADGQYDEAQVGYTVDNTLLTPAYFYDFEDASHLASYWQINDPAGPGTWQRTNYRYYRGANSAYCGITSTHLYGAYEYDWLISPTLDLTGAYAPYINFFHRYNTESGYDYVNIYATTDLDTWDLLGRYDGSSGGWQRVLYSLSAYNQPVKLAFMLQSDPAVEAEGWYLDDVMVRQAPIVDSVSPNRAAIGQTVTITGSNFGSFYLGAFSLNGHGNVTAGEITSWSDTQIVLNVPSGTMTGNVNLWWHDTGQPLTIVLPAPSLTGTQQY